MDHSYIDEHNVADCYILGTLSGEERARFEEHFVDCPECQDRLEDAARWRTALKAAAAEGRRVISWPSKTAALLLAACLILGVAPLLLWRELSRVRADLDRTRNASVEWHRRYQESLQARSEPPPLPSTAPLFPLILTRDGATEPSAPPARIVLPQRAPWAVFSLELVRDPSLLSYRATLSAAGGRQVWTASDLKPFPAGSLALVIPSQLLQPGDYILTVEGLTTSGRFIRVGRYPFRVEK